MKPLTIPLRVYTGLKSGTPILIILNAEGMSSPAMQGIVEQHGLEAGFVFDPPAGSDYDYEIRFWTSIGEQDSSECTTVGAVWLISRLEKNTRNNLRIFTKGGHVEARITRISGENVDNGIWVDISRPTCTVMQPLGEQRTDNILCTLGIEAQDLIPGLEIQNVATSRVKTLIPIGSIDKLDSLVPEYRRIKKLCERIGSTGLYPYAIIDQGRQEYAARHFARHYGYVEDAVNGVAASALSFELLVHGYVHDIDQAVKIQQGSARGSPSEVNVKFRTWGDDVVGCWIGGTAEFEHLPRIQTEDRSTGSTDTA